MVSFLFVLCLCTYSLLMFNTRLQIVQRLQDIVTFKMSRSRKKCNVRKVSGHISDTCSDTICFLGLNGTHQCRITVRQGIFEAIKFCGSPLDL